MRRDEIELTSDDLTDLARAHQTPVDVRERVLMIADMLAKADVVVAGRWGPHQEFSYIFERRLRRQLKRQPDRLTTGLVGLVDGLRDNPVDEVLLIVVQTETLWSHIYAVGEPEWLIGCTMGPVGNGRDRRRGDAEPQP